MNGHAPTPPPAGALIRRLITFEDGGRAAVADEAIAGAVFCHARNRGWYANRSPDTSLLEYVREMTYALEVSARSRAEWAYAIRTGLECLRAVWLNGGGVLHQDLTARSLSFISPLTFADGSRPDRWQPPLGREPVVDRRSGLPELLLDPRPAGDARYVRVGQPSVFRHFAEDVLPVDQGGPAAPQVLELQLQPSEMLAGSVVHPRDHLGRAQAPGVREALRDPVQCAWPGNDELALVHRADRRVAEVDRVLVSQERPQRRQRSQQVVRRAQIRCGCEGAGQPGGHCVLDQPQVIAVLAGLAERRVGDDVRRRVDPLAAAHRLAQDLVIGGEAVASPGRAGTQLADKQLPGLDPVEDLEQQDAEHHLVRVLRPGVDHLADQVLRHPVRSPVHAGELVPHQDRVVGPRGGHPRCPAVEDPLPFGGELPVHVETLGDLEHQAASPEPRRAGRGPCAEAHREGELLGHGDDRTGPGSVAVISTARSSR